MRKLIPVLLVACGGGELAPGSAVISGAQAATVKLMPAEVRCCPASSIDCLTGCGFSLSDSAQNIEASIAVHELEGRYTDTTASGYVRCYRTDVAPAEAQLAVWDAQSGKQGTFSLSISQLREVRDGFFAVHGSLHAECKPTDQYGPGNPATGTVTLDAQF